MKVYTSINDPLSSTNVGEKCGRDILCETDRRSMDDRNASPLAITAHAYDCQGKKFPVTGARDVLLEQYRAAEHYNFGSGHERMKAI
jgi:hypothetical protein